MLQSMCWWERDLWGSGDEWVSLVEGGRKIRGSSRMMDNI